MMCKAQQEVFTYLNIKVTHQGGLDRHRAAVHMQVQHPSGFIGNVVVIVASQPEIAPLTYQVVDRGLVVQSLGFNLLSERSS